MSDISLVYKLGHFLRINKSTHFFEDFIHTNISNQIDFLDYDDLSLQQCFKVIEVTFEN